MLSNDEGSTTKKSKDQGGDRPIPPHREAHPATDHHRSPKNTTAPNSSGKFHGDTARHNKMLGTVAGSALEKHAFPDNIVIVNVPHTGSSPPDDRSLSKTLGWLRTLHKTPRKGTTKRKMNPNSLRDYPTNSSMIWMYAPQNTSSRTHDRSSNSAAHNRTGPAEFELLTPTGIW